MALTRRRNPGPSWGYSFLLRTDTLLPASVSHWLLGLGTWVAVAAMPAERRCSREYLAAALGRPARIGEVWRHFRSFADALMVKLRVGEGAPHRCVHGPDCDPIRDLAASGRPALFGTFHLGRSDLLGFMLAPFGRKIHMIRLRVENSGDVERLSRRFGQQVAFVWVNEAESLLFALKEIVQEGGTVAMKCDRIEHSSKLEPFEFLGRRRLFPFTIYHLAIIFRRPVAFCLGLPDGPETSRVRGSSVFEPDLGPREANLARARAHFQEFLFMVEAVLRQNPYLWFNFIPLNPLAEAAAPDR